MTDLKVSQLRLLAKLVRTGSLTQSAKELGLSVSVASRMLKQMKDHFNDPLFVRTYRGMVPTATVERMLPGLESLMCGLDALEGCTVFEPQKLETVVTIAAADNAIVAILMPVVRHLSEAAPGVQIRIEQIDRQQFEWLAKGELDFLLYPTVAMPVLPPHFKSLILFPLKEALLVASDHPIAKAYLNGIMPDPREVACYPRIVVRLREKSRGSLMNMDLKAATPSPNVLEVPYFLGAPYFLEGTCNVLPLPRVTAEFFASRNPGLTAIPWSIAEEVPYTRLIWHERSDNAPHMQWLRSVIKEYAGAVS